jgi:hypothetical protein
MVMSRIRLHSGLCRAVCAVGAVLWLGGLAASAAEKAAPRPLFPNQEVRSVLPESETKKKSDPGKVQRLAPDSPLNGVADLPLFLPPSQQPQNRGPLSRDQLEEIDKRKNWIFLDAKSAGHSADKMLGVREEKTYEDEREYKDLMQQHLEKGNASDDTGKKSDPDAKAEAKAQNDADAKSEAKTANGDSFFILPGDNARYGLKGDTTEARAFGAKPAMGASSSLIPGGAPPSSGSLGGLSAPTSGFGRPGSYLPEAGLNPQKTHAQKEWAAEFKQILEGKPTTGGFGRDGDPAGWFNDPSKQSLNPVIGVRPDSYSRSVVPATPGFTLPSRPTGFDTFNRTPSLSDNGSSLFGAPGISSPGFAPQIPPPSAPRSGTFQDIPKRKF